MPSGSSNPKHHCLRGLALGFAITPPPPLGMKQLFFHKEKILSNLQFLNVYIYFLLIILLYLINVAVYHVRYAALLWPEKQYGVLDFVPIARGFDFI